MWLIQVGVALMTYVCREEPSVTCWWWESPGVSGPFTAVSLASELWTFTVSCKKMNEFGEVWLIQVGVALTTYACREEPSVTCCLWECIKEQRNRHTFSGFWAWSFTPVSDLVRAPVCFEKSGSCVKKQRLN